MAVRARGMFSVPYFEDLKFSEYLTHSIIVSVQNCDVL